MPLTATEALRQARELQAEFEHNKLIEDRRAVLSRERSLGDLMDELGITSAKLKDILPWQSEAPNQEGHLYAGALSLARPECHVFVRSEQPGKQRIGDDVLEPFYQAIIDMLLAEDYDVMRHVAIDGIGLRRMDEKERYFNGRPKRGRGEEAEAYNERVEEFQRDVGLPFEFATVDPQSFYYIENRQRTEVVFATEVLRTRESEVKEGGRHDITGELTLIRTPERCYHFWVPQPGDQSVPGTISAEGEPIYDEPNRFGHTGYFLYRGRYTGMSQAWRRYEPLIMATLNVAQHKSVFATLQANFAVQAGIHWIEHDLPRAQDASQRLIDVERKKSTKGVTSRTTQGAPAAELEQGAHLRFREMAGEFGAVVQALDIEEERYRFKDVLMGEASADASGRAIIRLQEAAGRQLAHGFRERKRTTEEILRVIRKTLFGRPEYLGSKTGATSIYIPRMIEGRSEAGQHPLSELIGIRTEHNIPHDIQVTVQARSDAAQLAWIEEGMKLKGEFPQDYIDRDFYDMKDVAQANRLRVKDQVRAGLLPQAVQQGIKLALTELGNLPVQSRGTVVQEQPTNGTGPVPAAVSAGPTPPQVEDVGTALGGGGGLMPGPEVV